MLLNTILRYFFPFIKCFHYIIWGIGHQKWAHFCLISIPTAIIGKKNHLVPPSCDWLILQVMGCFVTERLETYFHWKQWKQLKISALTARKKWSHFDLKRWVTGRWVESQFDSNILQLLGIPSRILVPQWVTQVFRSK